MDDRAGTGRVSLPEFGPLDAVLGYALFYYLVGLATPLVTAVLSRAGEGFAPEPIGTVAAALLWFVLALVVFGQVAEQVQANPHTFESPAARRRFLSRAQPSGQRYAWWAAWVLVGGVVAAASFESFLVSFERLLRWVLDFAVRGPSGPRLRVVDVVRLVVFALGYALLTAGLDRLVIGSVRSLVASGYRTEET